MKHFPTCSGWNRGGRAVFFFVLLTVGAAAALGVNIAAGSVSVPFSEVLRSLAGKSSDAAAQTIIWQIRFPRAVAAAVLGGALAVSGYLLQTCFHNPIAGPSVLGISSGAKLFVALVLVFSLKHTGTSSSFLLISAAFCGAMLSMGFVLLIAQRLRQSAMLVVSGIMIGYICSAVTDLVVTFAADSDIVNLHNWSMGSFSGISWENVAVMSIVVLAAFVLTVFMSKPISAYQLGEAYAESMGVNIRRFRTELVLLSSILSACVTAFAGPVSFVGIAVPQLMKRLFHTTKPLLLIPACFLGGAVWCLVCDLLARTLFAPNELSISTVTAIFGVPVVIYVLLHQKKGESSVREHYFFHTEQMSVGYDGTPLIRDLEIELKQGEILTLIGPNGAGKSTILKSIIGQLALIDGAVWAGNVRLDEATERERARNVSVVLTERIEPELLTCFAVVAMGRYPYTGRFGILSERDKQMVRAAMELVQVAELAGREFSKLSDGQRQRVLLAKAIAQEPKLLVLDEPTSFLDIRYKLEFLSVLQSLARKKKLTVIMSLHELDLAERISDKLLCISGARVERFGTPEEIFVPGYIEKLYGITDGSFEERFGNVELPAVKGAARVFVIAGNGSGTKLFRRLQRAGIPFSVGILWENDSDVSAADGLAAVVIKEKAFCPIRPETFQRAKEELERCSQVLCTLSDFGEWNRENEALLAYAKRAGKLCADVDVCLEKLGG